MAINQFNYEFVMNNCAKKFHPSSTGARYPVTGPRRACVSNTALSEAHVNSVSPTRTPNDKVHLWRELSKFLRERRVSRPPISCGTPTKQYDKWEVQRNAHRRRFVLEWSRTDAKHLSTTFHRRKARALLSDQSGTVSKLRRTSQLVSSFLFRAQRICKSKIIYNSFQI